MAVTAKLNTKNGVLTSVSVQDFLCALKTANNISDTIVIKGVHYTLSSLELYGTNGLTQMQGDIDCSANPNYPVGVAGNVYRVTVAGKIGGVNGKDVGVDDLITCITAGAAGNEAAVGANWSVTTSKISNKNMIWVDAVFGIDAKGAKYNPQRPFKTAAAAEAVAVAGDVITLLPGTYTDSGLGGTCEEWIISEGVIFNTTSLINPTWKVLEVAKPLKVIGRGIYIGSSRVLEYSSANGTLYFEFESIALTNDTTVMLIEQYNSMYVKGLRVDHTYTGGIPPGVGGDDGAISISGNSNDLSTGYVEISEINSEYPRGCVTSLENKGKLYMKFGQVSGSPQVTGYAVITVDYSAAAQDGICTIDVDSVLQSYAAGVAQVHCFYVDVPNSVCHLNYRILDNRDVLEGSAALKIAGGILYSKGTTASSKHNAIVMNSVDKCFVSGEFIASAGAGVMITNGILMLQDCRIDASGGDVADYGVQITGGVPIFDDCTVVTQGGIDSVYSAGAQNVKVYSLYTNVAMNVNITDVIGTGLLVVDAQVE